ncbi:MAG: hypothetical protein LBQ54_12145 [Planctomycetaceae bacterium]|nr:hypothetical protein [Planctomycetaceae bacterium]
MKKREEKDPEFMQFFAALEAVQLPDDPYLERATEEQQRKFVEVHKAFFDLLPRYMDEEIEATFIPEQWQTLQTVKMQLMPEMGLPVPSLFEPLGLSDEQREQMETVKQSMNAEFETLLDGLVEIRKEQIKEMAALLTESPEGDISDLSEENFIEKMQEASKKAFQSEKIRRKTKENNEQGKKLATELKMRLMNVLTDEQLDRMQELIDNMPDFAVSALDMMSKQRQEREKKKQRDLSPDAWRPGDGVPEQFKKERKSGQFPSGL